MQELAAGRSIVALTKDRPEPLYDILHKMQGIISIVLVPIFIADAPWGYMGFDDCNRERNWRSEEIDALKAGANILGAFLQQEKLKRPSKRLKPCKVYCRSALTAKRYGMSGAAGKESNTTSRIIQMLSLATVSAPNVPKNYTRNLRDRRSDWPVFSITSRSRNAFMLFFLRCLLLSVFRPATAR